MKGLIKNNLLAAWLNAKIFMIFMLVMSVIIIFVPDQTLHMYYVMIGIVGLSVIAATAIGNEFSSKWGKYKLTLPVKRKDIVKSMFLNHLLWMLFGVCFTGIAMGMFYMIHGFSADHFSGIISLFALGISISMFMGAIFIPMIYVAGEEKMVVFLIIALLCAVGIAAIFFGITEAAPLLGIIIMVVGSLIFFSLSYPVTACIFKKKEY